MNSLLEVAHVLGGMFYYLVMSFIGGVAIYGIVRLASAAYYKSKKDYEDN